MLPVNQFYSVDLLCEDLHKQVYEYQSNEPNSTEYEVFWEVWVMVSLGHLQ